LTALSAHVLAICDLLDEYHVRGAEVVEERLGCLFLRNDESGEVYDVNHIRRIALPDGATVDDLLVEADDFFHHRSYRSIRIDPRTSPPAVEARLLQDGWKAGATEIILATDGELTGRAADVEIVAVEAEREWKLLEGLFALDYGDRPDLGSGFFRTAKRRFPFFTYALALVDGKAVGFFSEAVKGEYGYLENLFVDPDYRLRGVATALVQHTARLAREKGARTVFLPADANDTPKEMYWRMGFRPVFLARSYHKDGAASRAG
jgi:ribosomal protein S18 acetylase RimI-like enzyme